MSDSLFEPIESGELPNRVETDYSTSKNWDMHVETFSETVLLEQTPALGLDYVYKVDFPSGATSQEILHLAANLEQSGLPERALCRVVVGPTHVHVTSDCVKRMTVLQAALAPVLAESGDTNTDANKDIPRPAAPQDSAGCANKLEIPTREQIDRLENNNPCRIFQLTMVHPVLAFHLGDSSCPQLEVGLKCVDATLHIPMYPLANVKVSQ